MKLPTAELRSASGAAETTIIISAGKTSDWPTDRTTVPAYNPATVCQTAITVSPQAAIARAVVAVRFGPTTSGMRRPTSRTVTTIDALRVKSSPAPESPSSRA